MRPLTIIIAGGMLTVVGLFLILALALGQSTMLNLVEPFVCDSGENLTYRWETHYDPFNQNNPETTTFEYDCQDNGKIYTVTDRVRNVQTAFMAATGLGILMVVLTSVLWLFGVFKPRPTRQQIEDAALPDEIVPLAALSYSSLRQHLVPDDGVFSPKDVKEKTRILKILLQYGVISMAQYDELIDALLARQE